MSADDNAASSNDELLNFSESTLKRGQETAPQPERKVKRLRLRLEAHRSVSIPSRSQNGDDADASQLEGPIRAISPVPKPEITPQAQPQVKRLRLRLEPKRDVAVPPSTHNRDEADANQVEGSAKAAAPALQPEITPQPQPHVKRLRRGLDANSRPIQPSPAYHRNESDTNQANSSAKWTALIQKLNAEAEDGTYGTVSDRRPIQPSSSYHRNEDHGREESGTNQVNGSANWTALIQKLNTGAEEGTHQTVLERTTNPPFPSYSWKKADIKRSRRPRLSKRWMDLVPELNEEIKDAIYGSVFDGAQFENSVPESQIGASFWSGDEKLRFFNALALYGRDDLPNLAAAVGKTMPEIRQYILTLEDATLEYKLAVGEEKAALDMRDVPAAVELSDDLVDALDRGADQIEEWKRRSEEDSEQRLFGEYWKLDGSITRKLLNAYKEVDAILEEEERSQRPKKNGPKKDTKKSMINPRSELDGAEDSANQNDIYKYSSLNEESETEPESPTNPPPAFAVETGDSVPVQEISSAALATDAQSAQDILRKVPAANLLHLPNLLELSTKLFMNTPEAEGLPAKKASMRHTALNDIHTIVLSVLRRLISVILFQANTRLRMFGAFRDPTYLRNRYVQQEDVYAALDILGMKRETFEYWRTAPRRLKLTCRTSNGSLRTALEASFPSSSDITVEQAEQVLSTPVVKWFYYQHKKVATAEAARAFKAVLNADIEKQDESTETAPNEDQDSNSDSEASASQNSTDESSESEEEPTGSAASDLSPSDMLSLYTSTYNQAQMSGNKKIVELQNRAILEDLAAEAEEEESLEALDAKARSKEEARLWAILEGGTSQDNQLYSNPGESLKSKFLDAEQRSRWRDIIGYRAEWEEDLIQGGQ
jgi:RNA polymerase I-specific transcription initiation factor RRN5